MPSPNARTTVSWALPQKFVVERSDASQSVHSWLSHATTVLSSRSRLPTPGTPASPALSSACAPGTPRQSRRCPCSRRTRPLRASSGPTPARASPCPPAPWSSTPHPSGMPSRAPAPSTPRRPTGPSPCALRPIGLVEKIIHPGHSRTNPLNYCSGLGEIATNIQVNR